MSFTDSFLDFEAIKNWFDIIPTSDMAAAAAADTKAEVPLLVPDDDDVPELVGEMVEKTASVSIADDTVTASLVGESESPVDDIIVSERREEAGGEIGVVDGNGEESGAARDEDENERSESERRGEPGGEIGVVDGKGEESGAAKDESEKSENESASSSSSSSSSSSDDEDCEDSDSDAEAEKRVKQGSEVEEGEIDDEAEAEGMIGWSDDEGEGGDEDDKVKGPIRSKNEVKFLPPVPPVDTKLLPHHEMTPVGVVLSIVGTQVVVEGIEKHSPLSDGSILWITETRSPLGLVDEIFGPVKNPYYVVRYNSEAEVPAGISTGTSVSFVPEFASHILNNKDVYKKGYDASGANDEELTDEGEFSDDEKEAEYKRMQKTSKRGTAEQKPRKSKNNKWSVESRGEPWRPPNQHQPQFQPHPQPQPQPQFSPNIPSSAGFGPSNPPSWPATPSGAWPNSMPFQHPQGTFFPNGFVMNNNNMMWPSPNPQQQHPFPMMMSMPMQMPMSMPMPMPMPNGMPFNQQQVGPPQGMLSGQPNGPPGFPFSQGFVMGQQNSFNSTTTIPPPFGVGLQGQQLSPPPTLNVAPNGLVIGGAPGNNEPPPPQQFNPGPPARGRGPHRRGGGSRFPRGRGRQQ